jgi:hypothetical protein
LCLFDQKSKGAQAVDEQRLFARVLPLVPDHPLADDGPENLLPPELFADEFYVRKSRLKGTTTTETRELRKLEFAKHVCEQRNPTHFERFRSVLEGCRVLLLPNLVPPATETAAGLG